jgi:hypothetical protein
MARQRRATPFDVQLRLVAVNKPTEMMKEGVSVLEDEYWPAVAYFFAEQHIETNYWIGVLRDCLKEVA